MDRFHRKYILTIQLIQQAIDEMEIDEGLAISVFLLAWSDAIRCRYESCRKHINGFYRVLIKIDEQNRSSSTTSPYESPTTNTDIRDSPNEIPTTSPEERTPRVTLSPLLLLLWKIAVRLDWNMSFWSGKPPMMPLSISDETQTRAWVQVLTSGEAVDWALAGFALDENAHRACFYGSQITALYGRTAPLGPSQQAREKVSQIAKLLANQLSLWKRRPVIERAELLEEELQSQSRSTPSTQLSSEEIFLSYPPMFIKSPYYVNLLNIWRALTIYISLMRDPLILSPRYFSERLDHAIDICRTLAGLHNDPSHKSASKYFSIFFAKIGFGGRKHSQLEVAWLLKECEEWARLFPRIWESVSMFRSVWEADSDNFWIAMDGVVQRLGDWWTDNE